MQTIHPNLFYSILFYSIKLSSNLFDTVVFYLILTNSLLFSSLHFYSSLLTLLLPLSSNNIFSNLSPLDFLEPVKAIAAAAVAAADGSDTGCHTVPLSKPQPATELLPCTARSMPIRAVPTAAVDVVEDKDG